MALVKKSVTDLTLPTVIIDPVGVNPSVGLKTSSVSLIQDDGLRLGYSKQRRCDLIYGNSDTGKTSNLGQAALWVWEKYGKVSRLISADGGGWKPLQHLVDLGIVIPISINDVKEPIELMGKFARGFWPSLSPQGKKVWSPLTEQIIEGTVDTPGVGCIMFEGLTSFADSIMLSLLHSYEGKTSIALVPGRAKDHFVTSGSERFSFSGQTDYGFVQQRIQHFVNTVNSLPFEKILCTALEDKGENEEGDTVYGPKIIGKKSTSKAPQWFGDCIHLESILTSEVIEDKRGDFKETVRQKNISRKKIRAYLMNHPDPSTGKMYLAKVRASMEVASLVPPYFDIDISDPLNIKGLNYLFDLEDEWALEGARIVEGMCKRPPPSVMYRVRGREQSGSSGNDVLDNKEQGVSENESTE